MVLPVIPPPNGEIFEGGYHVEKNPINGATTLVEPKKGKAHKYLTWYLDKDAVKPKAKGPDGLKFLSKSAERGEKKKSQKNIGAGCSGTM